MKNPVTESLISTLKKQFGPSLSKTEIDFLRTYYHRLSGQDFSTERSAEFRKIADRHRKLGRNRKPGETIVAIENSSVGITDGAEHLQTVIYIITDDRPFIVKSLRMRLNDLHKTPLRVLHPVFTVSRGKNHAAGQYSKFSPNSDNKKAGVHAEPHVHFLIDYTPESEHGKISEALKKVINDIDTVVRDWEAMKENVIRNTALLKSVKKSPAFAEYAKFFQWMAEDHFAFLGYCRLQISKSSKPQKIKINHSSLLGLLRTARDEKEDIIQSILPPIVFIENSPLVFTKTRKRAHIHRPSYMDCILLDHDFGGNAATHTVSCFLGFLAGSTSVLPTSEIPHIRNKAGYVLKNSTLRKGGYAYKELRNILETLPRDKLFHMEVKRLYALGMTLLNQERRKTRLHIHKNICGHFYSCLVYVPRDLFDTRLRKKIQGHLHRQFQAREVEFDVYFSDSILTRIHYVIHTDPDRDFSDGAVTDQKNLEKDVQQIALDWNDKLFESTKSRLGQDAAGRFLEQYRDGFSNAYQQDFSIGQAVSDLQILENLPDKGIHAALGAPTRKQKSEDRLKRASFKIYSPDSAIALSDILPILEHMGTRIHSGRPYRISKTDRSEYRILDFEISRLDQKAFDFIGNAQLFEQTFIQCWFGNIENDGFNSLTMLADLNWRQISMIRAYFRYLKQIRLRYSESYIIDALTANPRLAAAVVSLFEIRFHPGLKKAGSRKIHADVKNQLDNVRTLDEERIIRALLDVIAATLRTNYFQPSESGEPKPYLSFKLSSQNIPRIPEPAPQYEIFVYSPRMEGVHLRGGKVARGGLRWSERPEDFRTEVLGLVKAQRVKNAVIVPVGSKGGFVAKRLHLFKRNEIQQEVIACYRIFISGLLDITDNLAGTKVIPPPNVARLDEDDPYLVVAADKGTATFSDIANGISESYGFWLGDAFASGGSAGYDHKKMGITARGAWESVKRHFRELGKDIQSTPFTVAGIGDMGGDVFGNGMLLSKQIKLVAAFNHLHIFIDPDPDPASSYKERKRLFDTPGSAWTDYDQKLISKGGGVFSRAEKSIKLSPQARKALGAGSDAYPPDDLINTILKSEVELLWNGGIGTYVKSSRESHRDAQDRNNDSLRVDAAELRCKVIGEGGNLGLTQLGRIEFCQRGGLCYTDAIDNSAGVDTSDHEVNIKILLNGEMQKGKLSVKDRNSLLAKMESTVGELVLGNNYLQTQILSLETIYGSELISAQVRALEVLEDKGLLNKELEFLPDALALQERVESKNALTRPELAVLLSYGKMDLYQGLLDSSLPDDIYLEKEIERYFPEQLNRFYKKQIRSHRLKREIISTQITNNLIGAMGPAFHIRLADLTGAGVDEITACYLAARDITDNDSLFAQIQNLDNIVGAGIQMQCFRQVSAALESAIMWLLRNTPSSRKIGKLVKRFKGEFDTLQKNARSVFGEFDKAHQNRVNSMIESGIPKTLADGIAVRTTLIYGLDIIDIALKSGKPVRQTGKIYFAMAETLGLFWLQEQISNINVDNVWHERSKFSLSTDLRSHQSDIAARISRQIKGRNTAEALQDWRDANKNGIVKFACMAESLKKENKIDVSMLSVLVSELGRFK